MARTSPSGVIARPLVALVPTSIPNKTVTIGGVNRGGSRALGGSDARSSAPRPRLLGKKLGDYVRVSSRGAEDGAEDGAIDRAIAAVAEQQWGNITRRQLLDLGVDDDGDQRTACGIGRLYRVFRGVYSVGHPPTTPHQRAAAAVLACGPGAALSHSSAMTLWGYWRQWDKPFEVTVVGDRRTSGVRVHRSTTLRRQRRDRPARHSRHHAGAHAPRHVAAAEGQGPQARGQRRAALAVDDRGPARRDARAPPDRARQPSGSPR